MCSPAGLGGKGGRKMEGWTKPTTNGWRTSGREARQKEMWERISGWLSVNSSQRMELTTVQRGVIWKKEEMTRGKGQMREYLCLWRLRPCGRNSEPCPRHSRSSGKWRNSPPPQMWCPAQKKQLRHWRIEIKSFLQFYLKLLLHHRFVKNPPKIVMTGAVTARWHF